MSKPFTTRDGFTHWLIEQGVVPGSSLFGTLYVEPAETRAWYEASDATAYSHSDTAATQALAEAISCASDRERQRLTTLIIRTLDVMSADDLLELRDLIRTLLTDQAKREISAEIVAECEYRSLPRYTDKARMG